MNCRSCRDTGMLQDKDPDNTYPCWCDRGDPYRTRGELALKYLLDALKPVEG